MTVEISGPCLKYLIFASGLLVAGGVFAPSGMMAGAMADARASRSSLWQTESQAETRLVAAVTHVSPEAKTLDLGWQVQLNGNWKTYWRSPGDAGLPPRFDWSGSRNVADVAVDWPAPERITLFGLDSYVYKREVVLPLRVLLKTPGQAADLRLRAEYMVCEEICVPLEAAYHLHIPAGQAAPAADAALIARYAAKVPEPRGRLVPNSVVLDPNCGQPELALSFGQVLPKDAVSDIYVAGPAGVTFGRPQLAADGRYKLPVRGLERDFAAAPIHVVLRPRQGAAAAWQGVPEIEDPRRTCPRAGS